MVAGCGSWYNAPWQAKVAGDRMCEVRCKMAKQIPPPLPPNMQRQGDGPPMSPNMKTQTSKQKVSYLAIWSLALNICGIICLSPFITPWLIIEYVTPCVAVPCCALALLLGIAALIQRTQSYRRLWWLALVGIGIFTVSIIIFVIWVVPSILFFLTM